MNPKLEQVFDSCDLNADGKLSLEEFALLCAANPTLLREGKDEGGTQRAAAVPGDKPKAPSIFRRLFSSPAPAADKGQAQGSDSDIGAGGGGAPAGGPGASDALVPAPAEAGGTAALLQVAAFSRLFWSSFQSHGGVIAREYNLI